MQRRIPEHARGKSTYTRHAGLFELIYREEYATRLEARSRERYLKTGRGREELKTLLRQVGRLPNDAAAERTDEFVGH